MFKPLAAAVLAAALCGATLALPNSARARDAAVGAAAAAKPPAASAQAELATPKTKRARKPMNARRVAAVEPSPGPRCFLFWCDNAARPIWLVLGVAY